MTTTKRFRYRAVGMNGATTAGSLEAHTIEEARLALSSRRLLPLDVVAEMAGARPLRRLAAADVALFARVLSELLDSGLPLSRALASVHDLAPASWRPLLPSITDAVRAGAMFSQALQQAGGAVPDLMIAMVRSGETGIGLAASLRAAADSFDATAAARANVLSALTYPAFLLLACIGSLVLLVGIVLPRFATMLADLGAALPATTALLLKTGNAATAVAPTVAGGFTVVTIAVWQWYRTVAGRTRLHVMLLSTPVVGKIRWAWASATVCDVASALLSVGVTLPVALRQAAGSTGDAAVSSRIVKATQRILAGERPSTAIRETAGLTPTCVQLIRAGEESGRLPGMMARAARLERARATRAVQSGIKVIEPALVTGFGALVAFVAASLLQAIYAVRPSP